MKRIQTTINNLHNHLDEIAAQDILKGFKAPGKVGKSGFRLLPSTSSFSIFLSEINPILASIGLIRRLPNRLEFTPHNNRGMNQYAKYTIKRLEKYREVSPETYFRLVEQLINNSVTFRTMAFNKTLKNWYKELPLTFIKNIARKVKRIINNLETDVEFKRVYIPKKEKDVTRMLEYIKEGVKDIKEMKEVTFRPLGVPTQAWRIVLSMYANFITHFMMDKLNQNQHAYIPGKGTGSAWEDILNKIHKYKYIYEIDLKQCFPNIQAEWVTRELAKRGVPLDFCVLIEAFNRSTPKSKDEEIEKRNANEEYMDNLTEYLNTLNEKQLLEIDWGKTRELIKEINKGVTPSNIRTKGMPQGANTSPILTEIVLDHWITAMEKVNKGTSVFYADDGIFFSNEPIVLANDEARGIEINLEKSGSVKENGEWKKELKFCSLVYNPWRDTLRSETRKGAELEMDKGHGIFTILQQLKPKYSWDWGSLFKFSSLGGLVMNRLYAGEWGKSEYPTHLTLQGVTGSWLKRTHKIDNFKTTSSDAVSFLANGIMGDWETPELVSEVRKSPTTKIEGRIVVKGRSKVPKWVVWKRINKTI